jgi:uncharacterized protein YkwD
MSSRIRLFGLAVAAFLLAPAATAVACEDEGGRAESMSNRAYARSVECVLNVQRARSGPRPLRHDRRLSRAARRFSLAMVTQRFFAHVSPGGSTLAQRARAAGFTGGALGETIGWAAGDRATPAGIVDQWMHSPPHRAVILDGGFRRVGLGVASGSPHGVPDGATVTADFGG